MKFPEDKPSEDREKRKDVSVSNEANHLAAYDGINHGDVDDGQLSAGVRWRRRI